MPCVSLLERSVRPPGALALLPVAVFCDSEPAAGRQRERCLPGGLFPRSIQLTSSPRLLQGQKNEEGLPGKPSWLGLWRVGMTWVPCLAISDETQEAF